MEDLAADGVYLSDVKGKQTFIPWAQIDSFVLYTSKQRQAVEILLKEGGQLLVRIAEPFVVAQLIYKVLFSYGDDALFELPRFEIV
ncbi:MAG: hypothetical protein HYZ16_08565 [Bacteroidetes bacterium]|nr:hypothetical protein [Bacteroidota bacterium]